MSTARSLTAISIGLSLCFSWGDVVGDDSRRPLDEAFRAKLEQLATRCDQRGLNRQAEEIRAWFIARDPNRQYLFLPPDRDKNSAVTDSESSEDWRRQFIHCRREQAEGLFKLAQHTMSRGRAAEAFQLLHEVLHEAPTHQQASEILGLPRSRRSFRAKAGRSTHRQFGWRRGRYWTVDAPHFRIETNLNATAAVELASELEQLHALWQQVFFRAWSSPTALKDRFAGGKKSLGKTPKHKVVLFRDLQEYVDKLTPYEPNVGRSKGYYMKGRATAFFFGDNPSLKKTRFHEVVHQLFQESSWAVPDAGESSNFWVIEGIAVYFESLVRHDAYYTLGGFDSDRLQYARARRFRGDFYMPVDELVALNRKRYQAHQDLARVYTQSAGLVHLLMNGDGGRYRRSFTDFLLLVYQHRDRGDSLSTTLDLPFEQIDEVYVDFLRVDDSDLRFLKPPSQVRSLSLGRTEVSDEGLAGLPPLAELEWLDLSYTEVTDRTVEQLAKSPMLQQLDLEGTRITNQSLATLGSLQQLEEIDLSGTSIDDEGLKSLVAARGLRILWLGGTQITDDGLSALRTLEQLERVDISNTRVTKPAWEEFQQWLDRPR